MSPTTVAVLSLVTASPAVAAVFAVNSTADQVDALPGDGACAAADGSCTLRAAVQETNALPGPDTIMLPAGTYPLSIRGPHENTGAKGDLDVFGDLTLLGAGAAVTIIDGKKARDRVLDVLPGVTVEIHDVTIQRGRSPVGDAGGGGINDDRSTLILSGVTITRCRSADDAAGLDLHLGEMMLTDVTFTDNVTADDGGGMDADGGVADLTRVTFTANRAGDEGGGLEDSGALLRLHQVTIQGNKAHTSGAISLEDAGTMVLDGCTITGNRSRAGAAITTTDQALGPNSMTVGSSTITGNRRKSCAGAIANAGGNTGDDASCGF